MVLVNTCLFQAGGNGRKEKEYFCPFTCSPVNCVWCMWIMYEYVSLIENFGHVQKMKILLFVAFNVPDKYCNLHKKT